MFGTLLAIALTGALTGAGAPPAGLHFDCAGPVAPTTPAKAVLARYGKDARRRDIMGDDVLGVGRKTVKGVVLYPDDPARRLEITYWDDAQTAVRSVTAGARAVAWSGPLGLHVGATLEETKAANGHNFGISGFDSGYGGYVDSSWGGRLGKRDEGCAIQVRFALPDGAKIPDALKGEEDLDTTLPAVKTAGLRIAQLSIDWPLPAGIKASGF